MLSEKEGIKSEKPMNTTSVYYKEYFKLENERMISKHYWQLLENNYLADQKIYSSTLYQYEFQKKKWSVRVKKIRIREGIHYKVKIKERIK